MTKSTGKRDEARAKKEEVRHRVEALRRALALQLNGRVPQHVLEGDCMAAQHWKSAVEEVRGLYHLHHPAGKSCSTADLTKIHEALSKALASIS